MSDWSRGRNGRYHACGGSLQYEGFPDEIGLRGVLMSFAKPPKIYGLAWQTTYGVSRNSRIKELEDLDIYIKEANFDEKWLSVK